MTGRLHLGRAAPRRAGLQLLAACAVALSASSCMRPEGDFGRAEPDFFHDRVLPDAGIIKRTANKQNSSNFDFTDAEKELRDASWALILPPSTNDWIGLSLTELRRTGLLPKSIDHISPRSYYAMLKGDNYRSSETRYERVLADITADTYSTARFCPFVQRVREDDAERLRVLRSRELVEEQQWKGTVARTKENEKLLEWVRDSVQLRIAAYRYAIDAMQLETPSRNKLWDVNNGLKKLEEHAQGLTHGCVDGKAYAGKQANPPSRILTGWGLEKSAPVK
ncbi:hypothetical protein E1162_07445 [Rhodobacteraceae bacterium RKSG542]|uniref:hypothetical protein n=1 Tax=Pseudovibrio flavus TaxID=2529854 RepID=UPI0012BD6D2D|nr:hypothetical protein [Pseudovibrio flavus]MTI17072.1 hypothetical protein [Pseudovibrio flavus]